MREQITTPEELDALPVGTVLLGSDGHVWQPRQLHRRYPWQSLTGGAYSRISDFLADAAPLTVIYRPDAAPVEPRTLPTEAEVSDALSKSRWRGLGGMTEKQACDYMASAILALFAAQPTVAQAKAEALREMGKLFRLASQLGTGERDEIAAQLCFDRADLIESGGVR